MIELSNLREEALSRETQSGTPLYLLIDPQNVEQQWTGKSPQINFQWLQTQARLTPLAALPPYQLFRVEAR